MSFLPSSRPTLPPIRDVFPDEFFSNVNPPFNSPFSTRVRPWSDDNEIARPLPAQYHSKVHSIYGSSSRYSNTEFHDSALLHNHRLSHEHMITLVRPDRFSSFFASPTDPHQVLPQTSFPVNPVIPQCSQSISTSTDAEYVEAFEPRSVARCNSDASFSAFAHPPSFTHVVQRERRNSSASYECPYCGKLFNRPSSLKIHSNSHTGEKRVYNCILKMGKIDHTKRLAYACPIQYCGRSFSVLSNMRRHARSHGSYAVTFTESASDHYPLSLSSASSDLGLSSSSPIQSHDSHRRYGNSTSSSGPAAHHVKKALYFQPMTTKRNFTV